MGREKECRDHLGNVYNGVGSMCKAYHIGFPAFYCRITKKGMSLEEALTTPIRKRKLHNHLAYDHFGKMFNNTNEMLKFYHQTRSTFNGRIKNGWSLEEALTIPKHMYIGEYRVVECLKRLNVKFYRDCSIKTIFQDLHVDIDWNAFLLSLQKHLGKSGINWSKEKIQRLCPDFVLYTDEDNIIRGVIEFDGEQHQNFVEFFFKTVEEFYRRSNTDFAKQSLWEYMNVPMLRIRYDQVDMIDDMVTDFIEHPQNYICNHNTYLSEEEYWSILSEEKTKLDLAFVS